MTAFLITLSSWLPPPLRALATEARIKLLVQFGMFGLVGLIGFVADAATIYALRDILADGLSGPIGYLAPAGWTVSREILGDVAAGIPAFFIAATCTWFFNRQWTFRHAISPVPWHVQWRRFLAANLLGFLVNRGVYTAMVALWATAAREPAIAVFAGAVAGIALNFNLSRKMVFR
jgi:hypothetical protein